MQVTFFDTRDSWTSLLPLTYTRPASDLRVGILKIHEKWERRLGVIDKFFLSESYLESTFNRPKAKTLFIQGNLLPDDELVDLIKNLKENELLVQKEKVLAGYFGPGEVLEIGGKTVVAVSEALSIEHPWDIFRMNGHQILADYQLITSSRKSEPISDPYTSVYGEDIFIEGGAKIKAVVLNAEKGPIYIGKDAEIQEGALIRGPHALLNNSVIHMGAKIRGDSTIGPYSKVGGELSNSVIQGYSNKGHDGFLGNSVIGEWCNLGADTNNSNLKNNYTNVKMWDYAVDRFKDTGLQFCGLVMGDHSKCGINTMFNTGTTVGVSANIFGDGFPRNFIPSFSWGGSSGFSTYQVNKALETASLVMKRRNKELKEEDKAILSEVFERTSNYRVWDKR